MQGVYPTIVLILVSQQKSLGDEIASEVGSGQGPGDGIANFAGSIRFRERSLTVTLEVCECFYFICGIL